MASTTAKAQPVSPFFKLPLEVRNQIYEYTLCLFSQNEEPQTLEQYAHLYVTQRFGKRRFLGDINLLLANKQIHSEGYERMIKKNLFVHVQCRGVAITSYLYSRALAIPIVAHRSRAGRDPEFEANTLPMPVMRVQMNLDSAFHPRRKYHMLAAQFTDVVVLHADFEKFCSFFEPGCVHWDQDTKIEIELNPRSNDGHHFSGIHQKFFTREVQEILLAPLKNGLRACPPGALKIKGCSEEDLIRNTIQKVAERHSIDFEAQTAELDDLKTKSQTAWSDGDLLDCARHCTAGIAITLRFLRRKFTTAPSRENIEGPLQDFGQYCFTFHLLLARCLLADFDSTPVEEHIHLQESCEALARIILDAESVQHKVSCASSNHWWSTDHESAELFYLQAKTLRLMGQRKLSVDLHDWCNCGGIKEIQEATSLWPNNAVFQAEEDLIFALFEEQKRRCEETSKRLDEAKKKAWEADGLEESDVFDLVAEACMSLDME